MNKHVDLQEEKGPSSLPANKRLQEILDVADEKCKQEKAQPSNAHCEENLPDEQTWYLIACQCTQLLNKPNPSTESVSNLRTM